MKMSKLPSVTIEKRKCKEIIDMENKPTYGELLNALKKLKAAIGTEFVLVAAHKAKQIIDAAENGHAD